MSFSTEAKQSAKGAFLKEQQLLVIRLSSSNLGDFLLHLMKTSDLFAMRLKLQQLRV